ncbi:MAG: molecular chaperone DnaJ [Gammaproteobacteria bacterium WSBS_2016_MAG_OTU1]
MKQDYYETLGIERGADAAAIKQSYRRLAMKYHPDRNPDDETAEEKFKSIQEAYAILSDPQKKEMYDRHGHAAFNSGGGGGARGQDFSSVFDDLFSDFFGNATRSSARQRVLSIRLKFEESILGCKKELQLNEPTICSACRGSGADPKAKVEGCPDCQGSGQIRTNRGFFTIQETCKRCRGQGRIVKIPCHVCKGEGRRRIARKLAVKIPAGIQDGETMRLPIGDSQDEFVLRVTVEPHPLFERDGDNIHISIPVSITVAALGGYVEAPMAAGGKVKITVHPETQSGAILRLRGRGAPNVRGHDTGDMLCHILVETPINLTDTQKKLLRSFEESLKKKQDRHSPQEKSWLEKAKTLFSDD